MLNKPTCQIKELKFTNPFHFRCLQNSGLDVIIQCQLPFPTSVTHHFKAQLPSWLLHYGCYLHSDSSCLLQLSTRNSLSTHLSLCFIYIAVDTVDRSFYPLSPSTLTRDHVWCDLKAFSISVPSFIPHRKYLS